MSSLYRVNIMGRELQVRSTTLPGKIKEIEAFVNGKLYEVAASMKGGDSQVVTIVTLMTIAEAYLSMIKKQKSEINVEDPRIKGLLDKLDAAL